MAVVATRIRGDPNRRRDGCCRCRHNLLHGQQRKRTRSGSEHAECAKCTPGWHIRRSIRRADKAQRRGTRKRDRRTRDMGDRIRVRLQWSQWSHWSHWSQWSQWKWMCGDRIEGQRISVHNVDFGARPDQRTLEGGQRDTGNMSERHGRTLGVDVPTATARRNSGRRLHCSLAQRLCPQPAGDFHPHRRRSTERVNRGPESSASPGRVGGPGVARPVPGDRYIRRRWSERQLELRHSVVLSSHWPELPELLAKSRRQQDFDVRTKPMGVDDDVNPGKLQVRRACPAQNKPAIPSAAAGAGSDHPPHRTWSLHGDRQLSLRQ